MIAHRWDMCPMCGPMVVCGVCGNISCNAGVGTLPDGSYCTDCDEAYRLMRDGIVPNELAEQWALVEVERFNLADSK